MQHHAHHHRHISSLMSHHWVHNKCNRVKGWHWRWLIYSLRNICYMFSEATTSFWKFHKFHLKTPELESLFLIKMMELYKDICSAWISRTSAQIFSRRLMSYMSQKYSRYIAILWRTILWIFRKWYMKTPKKNIHFTTNISI